MSYWDISEMAVDPDLVSRVSACAAQEGVPENIAPRSWAETNMLVICSAPGWAEAWASAQAGGVPNPGRDPGVITDGQILASVQPLLA